MKPTSPSAVPGDIASDGSLSSLPVLSLYPRDAHFAVMVEGRLPRAGHLPFQVAIPQEFHHRLRHETLGSLNQVLVALVRQALAWLDVEQLSLHAEAHPGPIPIAPKAARPPPGPRTEAQRHEDFLVADQRWPNAVLSTRPKNDHWVIVQSERQPRVDAQLTQIALPAEVHQRLVHDGMGAVSQLVISLARYALRRLDQERLTLEVRPALAPSGTPHHGSAVLKTAPYVAVIGGDPGMTVGQLIQGLSAFPQEFCVMYEVSEERWGDVRQVALALMKPKRPSDECAAAGTPCDGETRAALLLGRSFDITPTFDGGLFEGDGGEIIVADAD